MTRFWENLREQLRPVLGTSFELHSFTPQAGGDINDVYKLITSVGNFCIKLNDHQQFPGMFEKETLGLKILDSHSSFTIPEPIHVDQIENQSYLLMTYIESASKGKDYWETFGNSLAQLHQNSQSEFGLDHDNYIGSLKQINEPRKSWADFFYFNRVLKQVELAMEKDFLSVNDRDNAGRLYHKLNSLVPNEKPALIHGDLWSGNAMTDEKGKPCILDPAVYYGHREMDLAMTKLFGGFDTRMYENYNSTFPLEKNWEERIEIHNLYPLLVHVNLFGGGYINQVKGILRRYS